MAFHGILINLFLTISTGGNVLTTRGYGWFDGIAMAIGEKQWSLRTDYHEKTVIVEEQPIS